MMYSDACHFSFVKTFLGSCLRIFSYSWLQNILLHFPLFCFTFVHNTCLNSSGVHLLCTANRNSVLLCAHAKPVFPAVPTKQAVFSLPRRDGICDVSQVPLDVCLVSLCSSIDAAQLLYQCCTDFIAVTLLLIYILISNRVNPPTLCPCFFFFFLRYCLEGQSKNRSGVTSKLQVRYPDPYSTRENSRENEKGWILMESGWRKSKDTMKVVFLS